MRNYRISLSLFLSLTLCALCLALASSAPQQSAAAQQGKAVAAKDPQKPATPAKPAAPVVNEDEPVALTPRTAAAVEDAPAKPAPTLLPNQYGNFRFPAANGKGQVAFLAIHTAPDTAAGYTQSLFVTSSDGAWKVTRESEKILNLKDDFNAINGVTINQNGDLTFTAQLAGKEPLPENPNAPNREQFIPRGMGLFMKTAEGIKVLLRLGEEVPNMPSFFSSLANASSNSKGQTAFVGAYADPDGKGLFILENGKARLIARSGQKIVLGEDRVFSEHYYPGRINERGEIAWLSRIGSDGAGIFVLRDGKIQTLALQGKPAPVKYKDAVGKEKAANFIGFGNRAPAINDNGDVVFAAFYDGPEYGRALFMKPLNGPLQLLAKSGDGIKGMTVKFTDFNYVALNNRGELAFLGNYGARTRGIFFRKGATIEPVVLLEQKLPNGKPEDIVNQFIAPVINDRGEVFFYGQFRNSQVALFQWDAAQGLRTLARRGDKMPEIK